MEHCPTCERTTSHTVHRAYYKEKPVLVRICDRCFHATVHDYDGKTDNKSVDKSSFTFPSPFCDI